MNDHTKTVVARIPDCNFEHLGHKPAKAKYDGKTTMGPWANMCDVHFKMFGVGLGLGRGQELVLYLDSPADGERPEQGPISLD